MKRGKYKFLKLLNQYRSLNYELKYVKEVLREGHQEFEQYYRTWCVENDVDIDQLNKRNQRKVDMVFIEEKAFNMKAALALMEFKEEKETVRDLKNLYKAVAKKLHPDTIANDDPRKPEYEEAFKKATGANKEGRWGDLFDIVDKYNIKLDEYTDAVECLRFDIDRITAELEKEKSTYSWLLHEAETKSQKDQVVRNFLKQLFGWNG
tara:strand:- start:58 stop:678 length:621 start_codon:yes stop_codon:yes gene_type:complete